MATTNYIIKNVNGSATALDASQVLWTVRTTMSYTVFKLHVGSTTADEHLVNLVPSGAKIVSARLLLRTAFAAPGITSATLGLGYVAGDNDNALVTNFNGRGAVGSQGTVGTAEPYDSDGGQIWITLTTDTAMENLTAGLVAIQINYVLPTV
jgi:hypothetical protein